MDGRHLKRSQSETSVLKLRCVDGAGESLGYSSKSLRLALIRLPEVHFLQNVTLRMCVGCIQP